MKKTALFIFLFVTFNKSYAQNSLQESKYRRSSLSMILLETDNFPNKEAVLKSWNNYPFPEKYNKHEISVKSVNVDALILPESVLIDAGYLSDTLNGGALLKAELSLKNLKYLDPENKTAIVLPSEKTEIQLKIDNIIKEQKLANKIVASWFNRQPDGKFDMKLIQERGFYNASDLEASIAKGQSKGLASLGDAGEELIRNSFVTFTKLTFSENEPIARAARDAAQAEITKRLASSPQFLIDKALQVAEKAYEKAKEGYSLFSKTWLYRLNWNDSIAAVFYNDLWSKPEAFETSDIFSLEYVGVQYNQSLVTFKLGPDGKDRSQEELIDIATVRNIDNAFAELQKENDVFKPRVPILSVNPIMAKIGMKDGLSGGEKFDVFEMRLNSETGLTEYIKVGSAVADKKIIWDNRYNAGSKPEIEQLDANGVQILGTTFTGGNKIQPGMLIKLVK